MMAEFFKTCIPQSLSLYRGVTWEFHHTRMFQDCVLSLELLFFSEFIVDRSTNRTGQVISCVLTMMT